MSEYIRQNCVTAVPMTYGEYKAKNPGATDYKNQPTEADGYEATYCTGYKAWIPKAHFERTSRPVDRLTFGMAVEAMKRHLFVTRRGWKDDGRRVGIRDAALFLFTPAGEFLPWVAVDSDILAEDWCIVRDDGNAETGATN
jgi:hypothetical protein